MATYESLIKIKGSVGDLVFYSLNGKNVVRKKSGFNKTAFKKSPSYEKVRQNSSEFGHCSKAGKTIRSCIEKYIKESGEPLLYQRFAKLMTAIKDFDTFSEKGKRTVQNGLLTEEGMRFLKEFKFGEKENFSAGTYISGEKEAFILNLDDRLSADEIVMITLHVDLEVYNAEFFEERAPVKNEKEIRLKKPFQGDKLLLYFLVIKDKEKITHMGFIQIKKPAG
ncbi:hypothetical protein N0B40_06630 [Chryseobacterium oranimense]|uniref:hypothetical protein n=1 Tax=Chryseobacterium oranimense TaxID=421058 RepID=UPI0021B03994|nr:hypothetical protein [Chryseobacterium oranimense]UWX61958.1 hypothetical protein N0B40_06630 [Chryseobacterium oranimense]